MADGYSARSAAERMGPPRRRSGHVGQPEQPAADLAEAGGNEARFQSLLLDRAQPLLRLRAALPTGPEGTLALGKRGFSLLAEEALVLQSFLEDCGARSNRTYLPLVVNVSALRGFAIAGFTLSALLDRIGQDGIGDPDLVEEFRQETAETREQVLAWVDDLVTEIVSELRQRVDGEVETPPTPTQGSDENERGPGVRLPVTVDNTEVPDQERQVAGIAAKFLVHKKILEEEYDGRLFTDPQGMRRYVREVSDEQQCRFFETRIQTLLATYDTFVSGTALETADPELVRFRSGVAIVRKLCRIMTEFVHRLEQGENDTKFQALPQRSAEVIQDHDVLDRALNYALRYMHRFVAVMAPVAEEMVKRYTAHDRRVCTIPEGVNLHIRPVSLLARIVEHYRTPANLTIGSVTCYAGSIVQMLMAAGANPDQREVVFEGDKKVLDAIEVFFACRLGENGLESLPPELGFLTH